MMKGVTVSVVVPAYNVKDYVQASIDSLYEQTEPFDEVIVVDDGSIDGTLTILEQYRIHDNFTLIAKENEGQGVARNVGMSHATGDYIYFFDSDDLVDRRFVEKIKAIIIEQSRPDLIFFSGQCFSTDEFYTEFSPDYQRSFELKNATSEKAIRAFNESGRFVSQPCLYISKRGLWGANGIEFPASSYEDEEVLFPLILAARTVSVIKNVFFYRRIRPNSFMTSPNDPKKAHGYGVVMRSMLKLCSEYEGNDRLTRRIMKRRAGIFASKHVSACKALGMRVDHAEIVRCAAKLRSPMLLARAVYRTQSSRMQSLLQGLLKPILAFSRK
ncbi:glycosyltransferase family A protein [Litchfieldella xinjiangensis]|uniref:glycosyltransferase family A protein n=1 Tax=Litchfieldella xinjiangensis TaxID=1166948 RepID=UPI0009DD5B8A|nr:glycosyltransferase family 2 protein [Halomonas xinjiangensis]